jgi:hypothetical protein
MKQKFLIIKPSECEFKDEEIEAPKHYVEDRKIQPIEVIEDWDLNAHAANALKYIARAGRKHDEKILRSRFGILREE